MRIFELDPTTDPRWPIFLAEQPNAGIFHTQGWLTALRLTYGYRPLAFATGDDSSLKHAVVFCENRSLFTGCRLVSLPFSDHCEPLAQGPEFQQLMKHLAAMRPLPWLALHRTATGNPATSSQLPQNRVLQSSKDRPPSLPSGDPDGLSR